MTVATIPSPRLLPPDALAEALAVRDLTDPANGPHAIQLVVDAAIAALRDSWAVPAHVHRSHPVVPVEDNYDRLGYAPDAVARDARYTRYVSETCVLRSHTSAMVPAALRAIDPAAGPAASGLAQTGMDDVLVACPGIVYRRDAIDRLHTGTPHQLDLWRVRGEPTTDDDLMAMIATVVGAVLPGRRWRITPAEHPYTEHGLQIDVAGDGDDWVEVGECGLASPAVLAASRHHGRHGLAMGIGLDRIVLLRKGMPDIRLLRATDSRITSQLADLEPYRPVSSRPAVQRDLSLAVSADHDAETLGDRVREALGAAHAADVEDLVVLAETPGDELPPAAATRIGIRPGQKNVLLRVVLRPVDHTLTNAEANVLRDRIYAALHEGSTGQWASTEDQQRSNRPSTDG